MYPASLGLRVNDAAKTGMALISVANSNLDGTGTIVNIITGASNGTLIDTITIKAIGNTTMGMIRLFITDGSTFTNLVGEINIPQKTVSSVDASFEKTIEVSFMLKSGWILAASTQNAESFQIIAEGLDTTFP